MPVVVVLYAPALQAVHATPSYEAMYPARQVQFVSTWLFADEKVLVGHFIQIAAPESEYVLTPHGVHIPTPVAVLREPPPHGVHGTPSDEAVYPARQVQI